MSEEIEDLIKEVAAKHGVALGPDDPLLILHTINQRLIERFSQTLDDEIGSLREKLEAIAQQWNNDAKHKAENILAVAIEHGRDQALAVIQGNAEGLSQTVRQVLRAEIASQVSPAAKTNRELLLAALLVAGLSLLASIAALWVALS